MTSTTWKFLFHIFASSILVNTDFPLFIVVIRLFFLQQTVPFAVCFLLHKSLVLGITSIFPQLTLQSTFYKPLDQYVLNYMNHVFDQ